MGRLLNLTFERVTQVALSMAQRRMHARSRVRVTWVLRVVRSVFSLADHPAVRRFERNRMQLEFRRARWFVRSLIRRCE